MVNHEISACTWILMNIYHRNNTKGSRKEIYLCLCNDWLCCGSCRDSMEFNLLRWIQHLLMHWVSFASPYTGGTRFLSWLLRSLISTKVIIQHCSYCLAVYHGQSAFNEIVIRISILVQTIHVRLILRSCRLFVRTILEFWVKIRSAIAIRSRFQVF